MTLDEAIKHCEEVAEKQENNAKGCNSFDEWTETEYYDKEKCLQCAADHRQLAEWLTDYKELRNSLGAVKLKDMKDAVKLLQELSNENDQLALRLGEAIRLLKFALEDFKAVNSNMLTCRYCKHYDAGIDDCGLSDDDSACEDICGWRYADEVNKLLGDSYERI